MSVTLNPAVHWDTHTEDDERELPRGPPTIWDWLVPFLIGAVIFVIGLVILTNTETPCGWCVFVLLISAVCSIIGVDPCGSYKRKDDILD